MTLEDYIKLKILRMKPAVITPLNAKFQEMADCKLREAAGNGNIEEAQEALAQGANIDAASNEGTPLVCAARENHATMVAFLLAKRADASLTNMFNQTALHTAIREGAENEIALTLVKAKAPLNGRDTHGATPSFYAAQNANADVLGALGEKCADFTIANKKGITPLMQATFASHTEAIDVLTKYPCGLDQQDDDRRTALMHAVICRNAPLVKKYLALGANFDLKDKNGETALAIAKRLPGGKDIADMLEQSEAARIQPFHSGTDGSVTIMKRLVLKGASA